MAPYQAVIDHVRDVAAHHIRAYDLDATTPVDVIGLAARLAIRLVFIPCWEEPNFAAVAVHGAGIGVDRIIVNSLLKPAESNYSIAHEIGHIVQDHREPRRTCLEEMADCYARAVLLPVHVVIRQIQQHGGDPAFLAGLNGVPVGPMRRRLQEMGVMLARECVSP